VKVKAKLKESGLVTRWSYSRWSEYQTCPQKFKYKVIDKMREPQGPAAVRGDEIHAAAERALLEPKSKIPAVLSKVSNWVKEFRSCTEVKPEVKLGVNRFWYPTEYGYKGDMWFGAKIDVAASIEPTVVGVFDWKSGKMRDGYELQTEVYALMSFVHWPLAQKAVTQIIYVDHGEVTPPIVYNRDQVPDLITAWERRIEPMLHDKNFLPRPGGHCRWCAFSKAKGGPCRY